VKRFLFALSFGAFGFAATSTPAADPAPPPRLITDRDAMFRTPQVLDLTIELDKSSAESLRKEPRKYVKCVLKEGDTKYKDLGIHIKGSAVSLRGFDDKPNLTLNMDKFVDGQRFHGMDKFHLANSVQAPTYLRELICGELDRAAGVPVARIASLDRPKSRSVFSPL
jgi:spore coat protein H